MPTFVRQANKSGKNKQLELATFTCRNAAAITMAVLI
jgi:hypothetical protein